MGGTPGWPRGRDAVRSRAELLALPLARAAGPGFARPLRVPVPGSGRRRCPAAESLREGGGGGRRRLSAPLRPAPAWRQEVGGRGAPPPAAVPRSPR